MKRIFLSLITCAAFGSAALAADLPSRRVAPAPYIAPIFTWTGFYVGVNAGYAINDSTEFKKPSVNGYDVSPYLGNVAKSDDGSFTGGAQVGYNYQMGSVVFGVEADINYANVKTKYSYADSFEHLSAKNQVEWFGTVRPRLGLVPVDRMLLFVTGGLAYGEVKSSASYSLGSFGPYHASKSDTRVGWTVGAGAEYAITDNVTVKGEYLYVDLGDKTYSASYDGLYGSIKSDASFHIVRAGLNYKF